MNECELKRSFIPASHRPYVQGSKLNTYEKKTVTMESDLARRELILQIAAGARSVEVAGQTMSVPGWMSAVIVEMFPQLKR